MNRSVQTCVAACLFASLWVAPAYSSEWEDYELSQEQLQGLLAAMPGLFEKAPSSELAQAMQFPTPEKVRSRKSPPRQDAPAGIWVTLTYPAHELSPLRRRIPMATCTAPVATQEWAYCYDATMTRFEADFTPRPIWLRGDISDRELEEVFAHIAGLEMTSPLEDRAVKVDDIRSVQRPPDVTRLGVEMETSLEGYTYVLRFEQTLKRRARENWKNRGQSKVSREEPASETGRRWETLL